MDSGPGPNPHPTTTGVGGSPYTRGARPTTHTHNLPGVWYGPDTCAYCLFMSAHAGSPSRPPTRRFILTDPLSGRKNHPTRHPVDIEELRIREVTTNAGKMVNPKRPRMNFEVSFVLSAGGSWRRIGSRCCSNTLPRLRRHSWNLCLSDELLALLELVSTMHFFSWQRFVSYVHAACLFCQSGSSVSLGSKCKPQADDNKQLKVLRDKARQLLNFVEHFRTARATVHVSRFSFTETGNGSWQVQEEPESKHLSVRTDTDERPTFSTVLATLPSLFACRLSLLRFGSWVSSSPRNSGCSIFLCSSFGIPATRRH